MYLIRDIILIALLIVLGAAAFVYFGAFNIAADVPHWPVVYHLLEAARQRSIEVHAEDIPVPKLDDPNMVAEGANHYDAMCAGCHLAPGAQDTEIRRGLYPQPPKLAEARGLPPAEAFWAIKHGIKLTAMPAWGNTHDNEAIWNIVAFLQKLPGMTADDYQKLTNAAGSTNNHEAHEHEHGHEHKADEQKTAEQKTAEQKAIDHDEHPADHEHGHEGHEHGHEPKANEQKPVEPKPTNHDDHPATKDEHGQEKKAEDEKQGGGAPKTDPVSTDRLQAR
jgi:mono/diheme cytochrome c family protein